MLVFTVGAATLGAEIAAARLMAPFFGASTIVWANTIATVLVALSIGYWLGGRLADQRPASETASPAGCSSRGDPRLSCRSSRTRSSTSPSVRSTTSTSARRRLARRRARRWWRCRCSAGRRPPRGRSASASIGSRTRGARREASTRSPRSARCSGRSWPRSFFFAARRDAAHVPAVRGRGRPSLRRSRCRAGTLLVPVAIGAALLGAGRHHEAGRRRARARGARDARPVRARDRAARWRAPPGAQRGTGVPSVWRPDSVLTDNVWDGYLLRARQRARPPAALAGHPRQRRRHDGARLRGVLPRHADRRRGDRRRADRVGPPMVRPARPSEAFELHTEDARPLPAAGRGALGGDHGRRLPPALHPVLPDHARVLPGSPATGWCRAAS